MNSSLVLQLTDNDWYLLLFFVYRGYDVGFSFPGIHDINRRDMGVNGRLFEILRLRGGGYQLAVNFDPQIITLFKEVRNLLWLNFQVPHAITNMAKDAKRVYPHAVSLMETVRTYGQTLDLIEKNKGIEWLVAEYRNEAQRMISRGTLCSRVCM